IRMQNRELSFRCIAYNTHRLTKLAINLMFSTQPCTYNKARITQAISTFRAMLLISQKKPMA
ncbi:MAG: hypothetical protein WBZ20_17725, partial [Nitrososphaeraceae archaeon]